MANEFDVIVIGAGFAGLAAATAAANGGRVLLLAEGLGFIADLPSTIELYGYLPPRPGHVVRPWDELAGLMQYRDHPYAKIPARVLEQSLNMFVEAASTMGLAYEGDQDQNTLLAGPAGVPRPAYLAPYTMAPGRVDDRSPALVVGFDVHKDFYPEYLVANLNRFRQISGLGEEWRAAVIHVPGQQARGLNSQELATMMQSPAFRRHVIAEIRERLHTETRVGFPAIFGLDAQGTRQVYQELTVGLDRQVFEIPTLPPSPPGIRLAGEWLRYLQSKGVKVSLGFRVMGVTAENGRVTGVLVNTPARASTYRCRSLVLATGGFWGHGLSGLATGEVKESILGLPVRPVMPPEAWGEDRVLAPQPFVRFGVATNAYLQPADEHGNTLYENVFVAGRLLGGYDPYEEGCGEGVSLASGYYAGSLALSAGAVGD